VGGNVLRFVDYPRGLYTMSHVASDLRLRSLIQGRNYTVLFNRKVVLTIEAVILEVSGIIHLRNGIRLNIDQENAPTLAEWAGMKFLRLCVYSVHGLYLSPHYAVYLGLNGAIM
jgi:hypothetical protein